MSLQELQKYTAVSKYARWLEQEKRRETWDETVDRSRDMMLGRYPQIASAVNWSYDKLRKFEVLGSQRALQYAGKPILQHNAKLYNCLKGDTQFVTSGGVKCFYDFKDGDEIVVLTHAGNWKKAIVRCYGEAVLYPSTFRRRGGKDKVVWSTETHRWLINGGSVTETGKLYEDAVIQPPPSLFTDFDYGNAPPDERLWWAYGYVYGDGTCVKDDNGDYRYSMVRLYGEDKARYKSRFEELGFKTSEPASFNGDAVAYTGHYLKQTPDPAKEEQRLIRAFVRGYLDADGGKNTCLTSKNLFDSIQVTGEEQAEFVRRCFPVAGVYVLSEQDRTGEETNFGVRPYTVRFRLASSISANTGYQHVYTGWQQPVSEIVWCLEVEDDHSFVLPDGLVTGNCTGSYCDRLRFFQEAFYLLLCGAGVGFSVQERHTKYLPDFSAKRQAGVKLPKKVFRPADSIEGWADTTGVLLSSYHAVPVKGFEEYYDCEVEFDLSGIREKGANLSFGIGKAPGPDPLAKAIARKRRLLEYLVHGLHLSRLRSVDAFDLVMHDSDAVLAGGVRRSATICIFDLWDQLMATSKTGNWQQENPQRARANISALLLRQATPFEKFRELLQHTQDWGEPGVSWADHQDCLPNPCHEIGFWCRLLVELTAPATQELLKTYDGPIIRDEETNNTVLLSGWQFCNLSTVPGKTVRSVEDFHERCIAASVIGTCQAGFTNFPYLGRVSEEIIRKEALLGVSICGVMHHPEILLNPEVLEEGARLVKQTNEWVAPEIGINPFARGTCIKPDGNSASLLGSFSGAGYGKIHRGFRIVQANRQEASYQYFQSVNPHACEKSKWSANDTDDCIRFPVEYEGLIEEEHSAIQALENVRTLYEHWVMPGKVLERCTQPWLTNNVSNTISVRPDEWDDVAKHVYKHRESYAGISFLGSMGSLDFYQAPFTPALTDEELVGKYNRIALTQVFWLIEQAKAFDNLWDACECVLADWPTKTLRQGQWCLDFDAFCGQFFAGDRRKATYCLKEAFNNRLYNHLMNVFRSVDYTQMREEDNTTSMQQEIACAGGVCQL